MVINKTVKIVLITLFIIWSLFIIGQLISTSKQTPQPEPPITDILPYQPGSTDPGGKPLPPPTDKGFPPETPPVQRDSTGYTCPPSEYIDCMPTIDGESKERAARCTPEYLSWATENCPNFKGAAY